MLPVGSGLLVWIWHCAILQGLGVGSAFLLEMTWLLAEIAAPGLFLGVCDCLLRVNSVEPAVATLLAIG